METLALIAVVILALLAGIAVPVLLQLRRTLASAQQFLDVTSVKTDRALADLAQLSARVGGVMDAVEGNLPRMQRALDATDGIVATLEQVRGSLRMVTAVGPAAFAAVKSLVSSFVASRIPAEAPDDELAAARAAAS